jgi:hypothetical protein
VVDVPAGEVGEGAVALVLELEPSRPAGRGRQRGTPAAERLQLRLRRNRVVGDTPYDAGLEAAGYVGIGIGPDSG